MSVVPDIDSQIAALQAEIKRVYAKSARWMLCSVKAKHPEAFTGPAREMLSDVGDAHAAVASRAPDAIAVALDALKMYQDDD